MFTYSSSSEKCLLSVKHDQIVMQTNHRRTTRDKTDSPREIKQRNSVQATKIRKPQSKVKRQHHFESTVHPALASRGFASHVFLVR